MVEVFPAGAGMNRKGSDAGMQELGVPRRRGDEPLLLARLKLKYPCSPQARG